MDGRVYNVCMLLGIALMGGGLAMVNVPVSLVVTGALLIGLTIYGSRRGD